VTRHGAGGFSLIEAIVATVIAVIAVLGLAYTFGIGRATIGRYEAARAADAQAQGSMEALGLLAETSPTSDSLEVGFVLSPPDTFSFHGAPIGRAYWRVTAAPATVPNSVQGKLKAVTVVVAWAQSGLPDSVSYTRLFSIPS
jgi:type II secretory pathway pseudopilin PulG